MNNEKAAKVIQRAYRGMKAKGPRNLPINVQKKILNLLPLKNQRSFINSLRNNRGNVLTKNYRKRKAVAKAQMNKLASYFIKSFKTRAIPQRKRMLMRNTNSRRFRISNNLMERFGLPINGNKLIVNYYRQPEFRAFPFAKSSSTVHFLIDGYNVYEVPLERRTTLHNLKYIGYIPKEIVNTLRRRA